MSSRFTMLSAAEKSSVLDVALAYVDQALCLDHKFAEAKSLRRELKAALSNSTRKVRRKRA